MSTTVTYKGSTLTTVENATKTLNTAGKYMEGDVIIQDVNPSPTYTATIKTEGSSSSCYVKYNDVKYYSQNATFTYHAGDQLYCYADGRNSAYIYVNGSRVSPNWPATYYYTLPESDIDIYLKVSSESTIDINTSVIPIEYRTAYTYTPGSTSQVIYSGRYLLGSQTIKGDANLISANIVSGVSIFGINGTAPTGTVRTAFAPAVTLASSTGVVTGTNTFTAGVYPAGTSTSTLNLTTKAAATINTSTADQTIASYRWLTGTQTIKSVTTSNLTAANIKSGVTIKVGDANNASRITQVTGTYSGTTPEYYTLYRSLATRSTINSGQAVFSELTSYISELSYVAMSLFEGQIIYGSLNFTNAARVSDYAFAFACSPADTLGGQAVLTVNLPSCSSIGQKAFMYNPWISAVYAPICSEIQGYTFYKCPYLQYVSMPSCTSIASSAFMNCANLTTVDFPECLQIRMYAFASCTKLTTVSFPKCTSIYASAFTGCSKLIGASFPNCKTISEYAFSNCKSLTTATFPECTSIYGYAFASCSKLVTISFPKCLSISTYAFSGCTSLESSIFPKCTYIGTYAFGYCSNMSIASFSECLSIDGYAFISCSNLATISFPKCTYISSYVFSACRMLTEASLPECTRLGSGAFQNCYELSIVRIPICSSIEAYAFRSCYNLISLYLNSVSAVPSIGTNVFTSTPISNYSTSAGRYGSIYVPSSLYNAFSTATGWSVFKNRLVSV